MVKIAKKVVVEPKRANRIRTEQVRALAKTPEELPYRHYRVMTPACCQKSFRTPPGFELLVVMDNFEYHLSKLIITHGHLCKKLEKTFRNVNKHITTISKWLLNNLISNVQIE